MIEILLNHQNNYVRHAHIHNEHVTKNFDILAVILNILNNY